MAARLFGTVLAVALVACAGPIRLERPLGSDWITSRGGVDTGPAQERAVSALTRLALGAARIEVRVLADEDLGAWAWPDGRVAVTRGLVEMLEEAPLAAALAHEIGHLVLGGHLRTDLGLPREGRPDDEHAADRVARRLLDRSGVAPGALDDLLSILHANATPGSDGRARLEARLATLD